jgi:hypothetical protein
VFLILDCDLRIYARLLQKRFAAARNVIALFAFAISVPAQVAAPPRFQGSAAAFASSGFFAAFISAAYFCKTKKRTAIKYPA